MIASRIAHFAMSRPAADAMVWNGRALTYLQLHQLIMAARTMLVEADAPDTGLAVVSIENLSVAWPWVIALQSLGLTTIATRLELATMLGVTPVACLVGETAPSQDIPIQIDSQTAHLIGEPLLMTATADDLPIGGAASHLMLSSGTTGLPKLVEFGPANEAAAAAVESFSYDERSVCYVGSFPLASAAGYRLPLRTWSHGGLVVFHQASDPWVPFRRGDLTDATLTPGILAELLEDYPGESAPNPGMTLAIAGGQVRWDLVMKARARLTPNLMAGYGSTEAGLVCYTTLQSEEDTRYYTVDPDRQVQIVDQDHRPCPPGKTGLVRIDTRAGVTEYWRDPQTTKTFFRDGWFYTGDLGRMRPDGRLELLGRANDVLLMRGDKRSARTYEMRILKAVAVKDVCIVQSATAEEVDTLHVFYENAEALTASETETLQAQLPPRMKSVLHHRTRLPRNDMGKVMRLQLRGEVSAGQQ